jgi:RNA polymerase sigma factor (sigma-70 family)
MNKRRAHFEAQVLPHLDAAYRYALSLSRSPADADDLVQEAVLRAYRGFDALRGDPKPWLMSIVRNCFFTARQQQVRGGTVSLSDENHASLLDQLQAPAAGPEDEAIRADQRDSLDSLLGKLPCEHREVLILREAEDLSYREIADIAGLPIGTVMSRLARARQALKELWLGVHGDRA